MKNSRTIDFFRGRKIVIATKHKKEEVMAPLLSLCLELIPFVVENLDTDLFGTFSGEVERKSGPIAAAKMKCRRAMELGNCDLAIASEGSFGVHPDIPFVPADEEFVVLSDRLNDLEIVGRKLSTATNFSGKYIKTKDELEEFALHAGFPAHRLILRPSRYSLEMLYKGIASWQVLKRNFFSIKKIHGKAFVETDMRACYNPRRMEVIADATKELIKRAQSICPNCSTPGFGITDVKTGLPCEWCNLPTRSVLYYIFCCQKCSYTEQQRNKNQQKEDPMYCDHCNP